jgi:uncharacterized lipoprotein YmbA
MRQNSFPRALTTFLVLGLALTGCGLSGAPPVTYVLGRAAGGGGGFEPLVGRAVIEVKRVLVPDYLDVSDIMIRRSEHVVAASPTGRWGDRLSVGVTRALTADLARRLPAFVVTATPPVERPAWQVLVEVEAFEPRADATVILVARWRLVDGAGRDLLAGERVSLMVPVGGGDDAAMVAAMARAVDALAERIATGVRPDGPMSGGTQRRRAS